MRSKNTHSMNKFGTVQWTAPVAVLTIDFYFSFFARCLLNLTSSDYRFKCVLKVNLFDCQERNYT